MLLWRVVAAAMKRKRKKKFKVFSSQMFHLLDGVIVRWAIGAGWLC